MFIILLLACKDIPNSSIVNGEEISYDDQIASLQDSINILTEKVNQLSASSFVVSEYEVTCTENGGKDLTNPYVMYNYSGDSSEGGCLIAEIDVNDIPYEIRVGAMIDNSLQNPKYSSEDSIARYGSDRPDRYSFLVNFGNDFKYSPYYFDALDADMGVLITSAGEVYLPSIPFEQLDNTTPGESKEVDVKFRVAIFHNKQYVTP